MLHSRGFFEQCVRFTNIFIRRRNNSLATNTYYPDFICIAVVDFAVIHGSPWNQLCGMFRKFGPMKKFVRSHTVLV